jgi:hypothetical protein
MACTFKNVYGHAFWYLKPGAILIVTTKKQGKR